MVERFPAPGPWITRDLKLCVLAEDHDAAIAQLTRERDEARQHLEACRAGRAQADVDAANAELERERMRLAACGVAALGYFDGCADEYKSASLHDVLKLAADLSLTCEALAAEKENAARGWELFQTFRRKYAELKYPGMTGEIKLMDDAAIAQLTRERDRWREAPMRQAATINRLAAATEDRNVVDAKRQELHDADMRALAADLVRVTAERDEWRKQAGIGVQSEFSEGKKYIACIAQLKAERDRAREALDALMFEAKVYAAHNKLEPLAQRMYDIAEAALAPKEPKP